MTKALTFLVVEDEHIISLAMGMHIRNLGHKVGASVSCGEDALAALPRVRPDLVLMDIQLEGELDGIETARLMLDQGGPPVVYATAYSDAETLARARTTKPLAYLLKPVGPKEILALVDKLRPPA